MPVYDYLALTPITVTALDADTAAHCARNLLDDAHATVDETCIGADITTGSTRLTGRRQLAHLAQIIGSEADVALRGGTLSLHRIAAWAQQLQDAFTSSDSPKFWCAHHGWDSDNPDEYCPDCVSLGAISDPAAAANATNPREPYLDGHDGAQD